MTPTDAAYYKLALFTFSAAVVAVECAVDDAARDAAEAAVNAAREVMRFAQKYAPHASTAYDRKHRISVELLASLEEMARLLQRMDRDFDPRPARAWLNAL